MQNLLSGVAVLHWYIYFVWIVLEMPYSSFLEKKNESIGSWDGILNAKQVK